MQKSGHVERAVVKTSEPLQNALGMRFVVKVVLEGGTPSEPWMDALVVRVWGAFGGVLRHPPKGGPRTENHFLKVVVCHFWRKRRRIKGSRLKTQKIVRNFTKSLHFGWGSGTLYP